MPRNRRANASSTPPATSRWRSRHGRGARGPVTGPHLPMLSNRIDSFDMTVASTADYLKGVWPEELAGVCFEVAATPTGNPGEDGVDRWHVDGSRRRIVLYRVPIQRLTKLHRNDDLHRRMYIEGCVFRAVAELLGKDPWDLAPDRFRHF
ncbi:hypothetical protein O159_22560 [Leifsonia xyli subsp. cynodontis DSM 46306]|uniref:Metallopeptidase family protein n=1 Tax=Leifsonia xyli subsp. cynodontis DSM 46306 TaxID=1389489 RepID=U3P8S1_LEIXC|nr:metallopeptidase family protein [Leifsonia xyli]AGW42226.1 hypothetical protein O159_22560 [Leifsonia xyli subsp. cynodontis DSM 46306]